MGKVMSMVARKANRFNVENRAHRILERDKPVAAPKYESNLRDMERALELDPQVVEKLNQKDTSLDARLKSVYVTSKDSFIDYGVKHKGGDKNLPLNRTTPEDFEYGFQEPVRVSRGRCTLRQAMKFITDNQGEPELWTQKKIADEYKLKEKTVENILKYYRSFNLYIPDKNQKGSILTQAKPKLLKDNEEAAKDKEPPST